MSTEQPAVSAALPLKRLLLATLGALAVAAVIICTAILPAEYNIDPFGVGKLSGLSRLWAPEQQKVDPNSGAVPRAREYERAFRTDTVEIPLTGFLGGRFGSELEYKVKLDKDATLIYEWEIIGATDARDFHYDFHGHTTPKSPTESMTVATYKQSFGVKQRGALTAPFTGIHGWQFSNSSDNPLVVRVKLSGFYDLIPSGEPGNEAGVIANVPAAEARPKDDPRVKAQAAGGVKP
jgi:hypothetical protein